MLRLGLELQFCITAMVFVSVSFRVRVRGGLGLWEVYG